MPVVAEVRVVRNQLPGIAAGLEPAADRIVRKTAMDIEAYAKSVAPVDTGALVNSITAERVAALHWRVFVGVEYAIFVEFGTRFTPAQPYLIPAAHRALASFVAAMAGIVRS